MEVSVAAAAAAEHTQCRHTYTHTFIVKEPALLFITNVNLLDLLFEQVTLVEEENDGGLLEPPVAYDLIEQPHSLHSQHSPSSDTLLGDPR